MKKIAVTVVLFVGHVKKNNKGLFFTVHHNSKPKLHASVQTGNMKHVEEIGRIWNTGNKWLGPCWDKWQCARPSIVITVEPPGPGHMEGRLI